MFICVKMFTKIFGIFSSSDHVKDSNIVCFGILGVANLWPTPGGIHNSTTLKTIFAFKEFYSDK